MLAQAFAGLACRLGVDARQQQQEFLAAGAAEDVAVARIAAHLIGDMDDGGVADVVAVGIVDRFEAIDVQRQDRERDALHLQCIQGLLQATTVEQAGQRVGAAGPVERADPVLQCVEAVQHRVFQLRDLEVPRTDAADMVDRIAGIFAALHVARQLPQRHRNAAGEPPGDQQRQQAERNRVPDHCGHQPRQRLQGGRGRTLGDDAPAGRRNRCIPGQHRHAQVVAHLLGAALATHHRLYRRIADHVVTDPLAIGVIEQATMTVDHVQVGTVAVVVLAQQRMQCAALAQIGCDSDTSSLPVADWYGSLIIGWRAASAALLPTLGSTSPCRCRVCGEVAITRPSASTTSEELKLLVCSCRRLASSCARCGSRSSWPSRVAA
ncbi:hypothetical protein G6F40_013066 [Rhizopus arrhizus]|nr:hypothetical protein G6F40_013066 [Rhizopus arrhizus]